MNEQAKICCFCGSSEMKLLYKGRNHPFKKDHGPFDFFRCKNCSSGLTFPMPNVFELEELYRSFDGGMIPKIRAIRDNNPLTKWYRQCVTNAFQLVSSPAKEGFCWMDVGAGNGELTVTILEKYPLSNGVAVDFHEKPPNLENTNIQWIKTDINHAPDYGSNNFDLIFLVTVLEHVMYPEVLLESLLLKLKPKGSLYITVPDFGSIAANLLGGKWPYFIPGEHLFIPSKKGIKLLLERICQSNFGAGNFEIKVNTTSIPYTVGYYWQYFGLGKPPKFVTSKALHIPTGILEASVILH
ncbi:MAG: class I SAM-dependent methyltransferase [Bacteroidetes bacterium]|nr:class I SAM-dependent methyltransferase [Bacteroidota bacterium]